MGKSNGQPSQNTSTTTRNPQRIVLLAGDEQSAVKSVLAEYQGADLATVDVSEKARQFAAEHAGKVVAAEWQSNLGWQRFLWCRK